MSTFYSPFSHPFAKPLSRPKSLSLVLLSGVVDPLLVLSPEVEQFYERLFTPPDTDWDLVYRRLINGLVLDGIWADLDGLFLLAAASPESSLIDLTATGSEAYVTFLGGPQGTFVPGVGWNLANLYLLQTGFSPLSDGVNLTQNDNCVFSYISASNSSATGSGFWELFNSDNNTQYLDLYVNYTLFNAAGTVTNIGAFTPETGLFIGQRTSSTSIALYRDDVQVYSSSAKASSAFNNAEIAMRGTNTRSIIGYGKSLDATKRAALSARITTLLADIGAIT